VLGLWMILGCGEGYVMSMDEGDVVEIDYTNHRGERRWRRIRLLRMFWGKNEWHTTMCWLVYAMDLEKKQFRYYALSGVHEWREVGTAGERLI
jgi:hypothetical protein